MADDPTTSPALTAPPFAPQPWIIGNGQPTPQYRQWTFSLFTFSTNLQTEIAALQATVAAQQATINNLRAYVAEFLYAFQQIAAIAPPSGGSTIDTQARAALDAILAAAATV